ncbi:hypothetical protein NitYY0826_C0205 [Nitratiruptor sp. YY08-26]|nr:hypothetical protein NitYY0813_C0205 [Nitratiruptor sp. YY08-13]BCD65299.1 hypothetical protein NitYY0826_C0205 [Nitratiruptor sp. YY08-26]
MKYFEDGEVEFVKYEMSSYHFKKYICDFYVDLNICYSKRIVPKSRCAHSPCINFADANMYSTILHQKSDSKRLSQKVLKKLQKRRWRNLANMSKKRS